jgi:hypothetical protein
MKSSSETGHVKNVANFELLVQKCETCGTEYNPSTPLLSLNNLKTSAETGRNALSIHNTGQVPHILAINKRDALFRPLNKLSAKVINALAACHAPAALLKDTRTIVNKIHGRRATAKEDDKKNISSSQTSFDYRVDHFDKLVNLLSGAPEYTPNEPELTIAALKSHLQQMLEANKEANKAVTELNKLKMARDKALYDEQTGLVALSKSIKAYFKSVYGTNHPQYKEVSKIPFRSSKKR